MFSRDRATLNGSLTKLFIRGDDASDPGVDDSPSARAVSSVGTVTSVSVSGGTLPPFSKALVADGSSTNYFSTASDTTNLNINKKQWTFDCWFKVTSLTYSTYFMGDSPDGGSNFGILCGVTATNGYPIVYFKYGGPSQLVITGSPSAAVVGNWHHYAVVRSGETIYLFLDGVLTNTGDMAGGAYATYPSPWLYLRGGLSGSNWFYGNLCGVRFANGLARWTKKFIPPRKY